MTIEAKIILDSVGPDGQRMTTFQLKYPRFMHADFMTHRVFSRNASSSRATPVKRTIRDIRNDPAMPIIWSKNQKGMQGGDELTGFQKWACRVLWKLGMYTMTTIAGMCARMGLAKQYVNRLTEPWVHISVVVTTSQLKNFLALRDHKDAMPELQDLAKKMRACFEASVPQQLQYDDWHLPYVDRKRDGDAIMQAIFDRIIDMDDMGFNLNAGLIKLSVARCARVSYLTHDNKNPSVVEDLTLFKRLVVRLDSDDPMHASPAEHQGTPDHKTAQGQWVCPAYHGNLIGFKQFRKFLVGEDGEVQQPKRKYQR